MAASKVEAVVLLSGGLDSAVTLAEACQVYTPSAIRALFINYGQRPIAEELHHAQDQVIDWKVKWDEVRVSGSLWSQHVMVTPAAGKPPSWEASYIPYRNGVLFSLGAAYAAELGAPELWVGSIPPIPQGYAFPDATHDFLDNQARAIYWGTEPPRVNLRRPLLDAAWYPDVLRRGERLGVRWEHTYSCFVENGPCGECPKCLSRAKLFAFGGRPDPTR